MLAWEGRGPVQPRDVGLGGSPGRGRLGPSIRCLSPCCADIFFFHFYDGFGTELKAGRREYTLGGGQAEVLDVHRQDGSTRQAVRGYRRAGEAFRGAVGLCTHNVMGR